MSGVLEHQGADKDGVALRREKFGLDAGPTLKPLWRGLRLNLSCPALSNLKGSALKLRPTRFQPPFPSSYARWRRAQQTVDTPPTAGSEGEAVGDWRSKEIESNRMSIGGQRSSEAYLSSKS
jgi:hypothetical protein